MPSLLSFVTVPVVFLLSLPLAAFAAFTTTIAFWILLFRVSLVYAGIFTAFLGTYISSSRAGPAADTLSSSPAMEYSPRSRRVSQSSSGSSGLQMRAFGLSDSSATLAGPLPPRDYEGVGGWRVQEDDPDEEALWMSMNSRLELPAAPLQRHHHRSQTSLNRAPSGFASPELVRTSLAMRTSVRPRGPGSGSASPEGYFSTPFTPMTNGNDRRSRVSFEDHDPPAAGSTASLSSVKITRHDIS